MDHAVFADGDIIADLGARSKLGSVAYGGKLADARERTNEGIAADCSRCGDDRGSMDFRRALFWRVNPGRKIGVRRWTRF